MSSTYTLITDNKNIYTYGQGRQKSKFNGPEVVVEVNIIIDFARKNFLLNHYYYYYYREWNNLDDTGIR